jgi:hypothetical protein
MDNLLEILVPLIFAAIYFFGNMFSSKSEKEERPPARAPSAPADTDVDERQIQEQIRRKIMARRQAATDESGAPAQQMRGQALREGRKAVEARLGQRKATREQHKETREAKAAHFEPTPEAQAAPGGFSWDESDNAYEQNIEEQMRRIEETKRRAEALRSRNRPAGRGISESSVGSPDARQSAPAGGLLSGSVRQVLSNPVAARSAFIYGEVLGRPIGLRPSRDGLTEQS